jgi:hypothetical protein
VARRALLIRSGLACVALGVGLGSVAVGCGDAGGSRPPGQAEPVPESVELMKQSMKERQAALKGRPKGPAGKR